MGYLDDSGLAYFWGKVKALINAKAPTSHASTATTYGVANASKYGHAKASVTTPKALGTAAVGSETAAFARGDHVHPMPTAEQVGARPANWMPTAEDIGVHPAQMRVLLWNNASPSSQFAPQTISLDLTKYGGVVVEFAYATNSLSIISFQTLYKRTAATRGCLTIPVTLSAFRYAIVTDNGCEFSTGYIVNPYGTAVEGDNRIIPLNIYGLEKVGDN